MNAPPDDRLTEQLTDAFAKAADKITVTPKPFEPSPFVLPSQPTRTIRKHLLLVAALILVAGAVGTLIVRAARGRHDSQGVVATETETGTGDRFRLPSDLDDLLLDLVAPTNGDASLKARFRFGIAEDQANVAWHNECRRLNGLPEAEQPPPLHIYDDVSVGIYGLPALATIEKYGVYRRPPEPPDPSLVPDESSIRILVPDESSIRMAERCEESNHRFEAAPAAAWLDEARRLSFTYTYNDVYKAAESSPEWPEAESCVAAAGGPSNIGDPELQESYQVMLYWVESAEKLRAPPGTGLLSEQELMDMAGPEAEAFVRCTRPYFDVIETILKERRATFIKEHEEELQDLRERLKALD